MQENISEILERTGFYTSMTSGWSMWPLIHNKKDNIIVKKKEGRLKKYDIPVYRYENDNKYIMHRIVKVKQDHYIVIGDNLLKKEIVTDDMICGVLVGFYKNGKTYIDLEKNKLYIVYSRIWTALYPLRPFVLILQKIYRKFQVSFRRK